MFKLWNSSRTWWFKCCPEDKIWTLLLTTLRFETEFLMEYHAWHWRIKNISKRIVLNIDEYHYQLLPLFRRTRSDCELRMLTVDTVEWNIHILLWMKIMYIELMIIRIKEEWNIKNKMIFSSFSFRMRLPHYIIHTVAQSQQNLRRNNHPSWNCKSY